MAALSCLRSLVIDRDAEALHAILGDEASCRYLLRAPTATLEETLAQLCRWTDGWEDASWAIVEAADGPAMGRVAIYRPGDDADVWEVGVMVVPGAQGRGLAARAVAEAVAIGFEKKRARRIVADIDPDNAASIRLFEKLGFIYEGRLRAAYKTHIGVRDALIYSLLADDPRPAL